MLEEESTSESTSDDIEDVRPTFEDKKSFILKICVSSYLDLNKNKQTNKPQMPQNLPAQFVRPSPKVLNFNEKRLHWASLVRDL